MSDGKLIQRLRDCADEMRRENPGRDHHPVMPHTSLLDNAATTIEAQARRIADLEERGIKAVIAYHAAICSPKGVVPDDDLYDPVVADTIQRALDAGIPVRFAPPLPDTGLQA